MKLKKVLIGILAATMIFSMVAMASGGVMYFAPENVTEIRVGQYSIFEGNFIKFTGIGEMITEEGVLYGQIPVTYDFVTQEEYESQFPPCDESGSSSGNSSRSERKAAKEIVPQKSAEERYVEEVNARLDKEYAAIVQESQAPVHRTVEGVKSQAEGMYLAKSVSGVALKTVSGTTPKATDLYVRVTDTDTKKSVLAMNVINSVATSLGGVVGPTINMEFGKAVGGKYTPATGADVGAVSIGIPAAFQKDDATYAAICVFPGGKVTVYEDSDNNPKTLTFIFDAEVLANASQTTFSIVRK